MLDQQVQQRTAAQAQHKHRPRQRAQQLRVPVHRLGFEQGKRQAHQQRRQQLHAVGGSHIAGGNKALLVERAGGDAEQRQHCQSQGPRCDLADAELAAQHQRQAHEAKQQPEPFARGHPGLAMASGACEPERRENRLQPHQQRHRARADAQLDGRPHAAQVARMHQHTADGQVQPLAPVGGPGGARHRNPHPKAQHREGEAQRKKAHRRRMRHRIARDHKTSAPDQHKDPRHPAQPPLRRAQGHC